MPFGEIRTVQMSIVFAIFFASAMIVRIGGFPIDRDKTEVPF